MWDHSPAGSHELSRRVVQDISLGPAEDAIARTLTADSHHLLGSDWPSCSTDLISQVSVTLHKDPNKLV